jgi:hypothetical protein
MYTSANWEEATNKPPIGPAVLSNANQLSLTHGPGHWQLDHVL